MDDSRPQPAQPVVYDAGMNVGNNLPYYLLKGYRVVAIDANALLVEQVRREYAAEVERGSLVLVNSGIGPEHTALPFYVNQRQSGLSSFTPPSDSATASDWESVDVPIVPMSTLVAQHGEPSFIKIDVEGFDALILRDLFAHGIVPPAISIEAHGVEAVCALVTMGYSQFQLVNCAKVGATQEISGLDGSRTTYTFPKDSAGPFDEDLGDQWVPATEMLVQWLAKRMVLGRGWYDVHARRPVVAGSVAVSEEPRIREVLTSVASSALRSNGERLKHEIESRLPR